MSVIYIIFFITKNDANERKKYLYRIIYILIGFLISLVVFFLFNEFINFIQIH